MVTILSDVASRWSQRTDVLLHHPALPEEIAIFSPSPPKIRTCVCFLLDRCLLSEVNTANFPLSAVAATLATPNRNVRIISSWDYRICQTAGTAGTGQSCDNRASPTMSPAQPRVAVVGAGVAGLACARALLAASTASVVVFEKSGGYGGRCATRTWRGSVIDHGVQFFSLRSTFARELVYNELGLGPGRPRAHELAVLPLSAVTQYPSQKPVPMSNADRLYLRSGNSALGVALASGVDVRLNTTVTDMHPDGHIEYQRSNGEPEFDAFDAVVCTAPLPQSAALLDSPTPPEWSASFAPNLTIVLEYDTAKLSSDALVHAHNNLAAPTVQRYGMYGPPGHILAWTACENAKVGRQIAPGKTIMVAQASDMYSVAHYGDGSSGSSSLGTEADREWVEEATCAVEAMWKLSSHARVDHFTKRWKFARVGENASARDISHIEQPGDRIFFCGDGVARRSRLEHALLNGHHAAGRVASSLRSDEADIKW
jgi:renalase